MPAIQNCYAFLIPGNGVFAVGDSAEMSYLRVELVEQVVRAQSLALQMGTVKLLPRDLVRELQSKRPALKRAWSAESKVAATEIENPKPQLNFETPTKSEKPIDPKPDQVREIIRSELQKFLKA